MSENSEQPAFWRAFTKPPSRRAQPEEPVVLQVVAKKGKFDRQTDVTLPTQRPRIGPTHWIPTIFKE